MSEAFVSLASRTFPVVLFDLLFPKSLNWELLDLPGRTKFQLAPVLLVFTTALVARTSPGQPRVFHVQQSPGVCKIGGVVKNSLTGQPIERVLVDGQLDAALTGSEGRFALYLPCGGYSQLQVRRPGYSDPRGADMHSVRVEPNAPEVTIKLTPRATITGHVSVSNGGDPSDLYFRAFKAGYWNGHPQWSFAGQAKTDSNGIFKMYELDSPANYLLCSQTSQEHDGVPSTVNVTYGYPTICYPSEMSVDIGGLLRLVPGQQAEVEISIARQPFYRVSIAVGSPQGQRQGLDLYSHNGLNVNASLRWKDEDQSWEGWLPNGTYYAESNSWGPSPAYGRVDFKVADTTVSGLRMTVLPRAPVEVVIHKLFTAKSNEHPPDESNPGLQLELIPAERKLEGSGGGVGLRHLEGDEPGHFEAEGVNPGRYWVQASYFYEGYISALSSGATDLTREPLVIGQGNKVPPIEVTVRNDGSTIDLTLDNISRTDAQGSDFSSGFVPNGPVVYAVPAGFRFSRLPHGSFGLDGLARIENLAPGLYHLVALSKFRDLDAVDPTELANLMAQGKTVRVEAGTSTSVRVDFAKPENEEPNP